MNLTKRQKEVLTWVQRGATNKQIAKRMGISESSVKMYIGILNKKYCSTNRTQLVLFSTQGVTAAPPAIPPDAKPVLYVHRHGDKVVGVLITDKPPASGWEPVYLKG